MINRFVGTSCCLALLFSSGSQAVFATDATGTQITHSYVDMEEGPGLAKISREEIKAELDASKPVTLVDALPEKYFALSHIPNSINIPFDQSDKAEALLPNKKAEIIVYCMDTK